MLIGEAHCSADDRGWLEIPSQFRPGLAGGATVTRGIDPCLVVYPAAEWEKLAAKLERQLPLTSRVARAFNRLMFSGALTCALDEQGRIRLPESLREYANINREVVVVGLFSHLEIWTPQGWLTMRSASVENSVALAEELIEFGI